MSRCNQQGSNSRVVQMYNGTRDLYNFNSSRTQFRGDGAKALTRACLHCRGLFSSLHLPTAISHSRRARSARPIYSICLPMRVTAAFDVRVKFVTGSADTFAPARHFRRASHWSLSSSSLVPHICRGRGILGARELIRRFYLQSIVIPH